MSGSYSEEYQSASEDNAEKEENAEPKATDSFLNNSTFKDDYSCCSDESIQSEVVKDDDEKLAESSDHRFRVLFSELFDIYDRKIEEVQFLKTKTTNLEKKLEKPDSIYESIPMSIICPECDQVRQSSISLANEKQRCEGELDSKKYCEKEFFLERIRLLETRNLFLNDQYRRMNVENSTIKRQLENVQETLDLVLASCTATNPSNAPDTMSLAEMSNEFIPRPSAAKMTEDSNKRLRHECGILNIQINDSKREITELKVKVAELTKRNNEGSETINELWGNICDEKIISDNLKKEHELTLAKLNKVSEEKEVLEIQLSLLLVDDEAQEPQTALTPARQQQLDAFLKTTHTPDKPEEPQFSPLTEEEFKQTSSISVRNPLMLFGKANEVDKLIHFPDGKIPGKDNIPYLSKEKSEISTEPVKSKLVWPELPSNKNKLSQEQTTSNTIVSQHGFKVDPIWKKSTPIKLSETNHLFTNSKTESSTNEKKPLTDSEHAALQDKWINSATYTFKTMESLYQDNKPSVDFSSDDDISKLSTDLMKKLDDCIQESKSSLATINNDLTKKAPLSKSSNNLFSSQLDVVTISRQVDDFFSKLKNQESSTQNEDQSLSPPPNEEFEDAVSCHTAESPESSDDEEEPLEEVLTLSSISKQNDDVSSTGAEVDNSSVRSEYSVEASDVKEEVDGLCRYLTELFPGAMKPIEAKVQREVQPESKVQCEDLPTTSSTVNEGQNTIRRLSRTSSNTSWDRISDLSDADLKEF